MRHFIFPVLLAVLLAAGLLLLLTSPEPETAAVRPLSGSVAPDPVTPTPLSPPPPRPVLDAPDETPVRPRPRPPVPDAPVSVTALDAAPEGPQDALGDVGRTRPPPRPDVLAEAEEAAAPETIPDQASENPVSDAPDVAAGPDDDAVEAPTVLDPDAPPDAEIGDAVAAVPNGETPEPDAVDPETSAAGETVAEIEAAAPVDPAARVAEVTAAAPAAPETSADAAPAETPAERVDASGETTADRTATALRVPPPRPLPDLETLLSPGGFDRDSLTRLVAESTLGAGQKAVLAEAIGEAQDAEAQARLVAQLRAALGI